MTITPEHLNTARELGRAAGIAAASWAYDGTMHPAAVRLTLAMMDNGDPALDDYLPAMPNLSGEWADDPTPTELAREIIGDDPCPQCGNAGCYIDASGYVECDCTDNDAPADDRADAMNVVAEIADAWEEGVAETFYTECERILRAAIAD